MDQDALFSPPPFAPILTPTPSEFADPIAYIAKIRPIIEKHGICKIKPPQDWQPPFAVDVETFTFVPRVQRINELEATTRVKLNFLDALYKFWHLQGVRLKVPTVGRKALDFHKLHKVVQEEGGFEQVTLKQKWNFIATERMNLPTLANKSYGTVLQGHYERILYPYDLFEAGVIVGGDEKSSSPPNKPVNACMRNYMPVQSATCKTSKQDTDIDYTRNSELKKLQYFGAGKKVPLPSIKTEADETKEVPSTSEQTSSSKSNKRDLRDRSRLLKASYFESDICKICGATDDQEEILMCSSCDDYYHRYCLLPPVMGQIQGDWRCPTCVAKEYKKPAEVFGFEQSNKDYTLASFGLMADSFKENYFHKSIDEISCEEVEKEFWRLTTSLTDNVSVLYGADIHALTNGSGFPTEPNSDLTEEDEKYITSKWNLNKLPVLEDSVLQYVSGDVSGMKVPWCYVGMCFSSFCWHIEDHWSYSINYMHWGEPKTWYGVPSSHAEDLERVMQTRAPELFEQSPDLLHHITTIMNPMTLMSHGIPVVKINQNAGEFVVTGPRAYHAGFNQGYNFAEAVNFCPADWLPMGRACIKSYKKVKRQCVFSHEELICKLAADSGSLSLLLALEVHKELVALVNEERHIRKKLLELGVTKAEREAFELLADDERQCSHCKTTCFLSSITCPCQPNSQVCIEHIEELCPCPASKKCLRYRYTLDEFPAMINELRDKVEGFEQWLNKVNTAFDSKGSDRITFSDLKQLSHEARENQYPDSPLLKSLNKAVKDGDKYSCLVKEVVNRKARTRRHTELAIKSAARRLTVEELRDLLTQLDGLICTVADSQQLEELFDRASQFQIDAKKALADKAIETETLEQLYQAGLNLDLDLAEIEQLGHAIEQKKWLDEVEEMMPTEGGEDDDMITMDELKGLVERGRALPAHPKVDKLLFSLEHKVKRGEAWEEKAQICLEAKPHHTISTIEAIIEESKEIDIHLPSVYLLKDAVKRAKDWKMKTSALFKSTEQPTLDQLTAVIVKAKSIPVRLEQVDQVEALMNKASEWKVKASDCFIKPGSEYNLLDVLLPRHNTPLVSRKRSTKKHQVTKNKRLIDSLFSTEDMYKKSILEEVENIKVLRLSNENNKSTQLCRCGSRPIDPMFQCELCKEWLHYYCGNLAAEDGTPLDQTISCSLGLLCSDCQRSSRPAMEVILSLLLMLQHIPVRMAEAEALQSLIERTIAWQNSVKKFLRDSNTQLIQRKFENIKARNEYYKNLKDDEEVQADHDYLSITTAIPTVNRPVFDIPSIEPDDAFNSQVKSLVLEGQLLEVTVPEMKTLWTLAQTLKEYNINRLARPPPVKKKSVLSPIQSNGKKQRKSKLQARDDNEPHTKRSRGHSISSENSSSGVRAGSEKSQTSSAEGSGSKADSDQGDEDDDWGDYDEKCAAPKGCQLPDDESIGWVQCETCELWFHFQCIGCDPNDLADVEFVCEACVNQPTIGRESQAIMCSKASNDIDSCRGGLTALDETINSVVTAGCG